RRLESTFLRLAAVAALAPSSACHQGKAPALTSGGAPPAALPVAASAARDAVDAPTVDAGRATSIAVRGVVVTPSGSPASGAVVAAVRGFESRPRAMAETDGDGRFMLTLTPGQWAFTATGATGAAAFLPSAEVGAEREIKLELRTSGFAIE